MRYLTQEQENILMQTMRACGEIMRSAHKKDDVDGGIIEKPGSANFVTAYDVRVQQVLMERLAAILPEAKFFAEEKENSGDDTKSGLCFVIDPIDGTTNFIHDYKSSAVSVGLLFDGKPVFGAVYDPYKDEMFTAHIGEGAFCNGQPIHVSAHDLFHSLVCFGTSPYYKDELADDAFALAKDLFVNSSDIRRGGSAAIDMCAVACGRMDVFFENRLSPWDYMASYVIITEAGGCMNNYAGAPVVFDRADCVVCTNATNTKEVLKITAKYYN
ncbi:MAG: inositol monophosphatase [Clostridia bacterium]|nr:inositol monophosphatase [Clostridia bacterium]MBR2414638.1 inositol monophosphatase [Clostridia bacterium]